MRKLLVTLMLGVLSCSTSAGDMTADDLIDKYFDAIGGEESIRGVESIYFKGSAFAQGQAVEMEMWVMPPDKAYQQVKMNNMVMGGGGCNADQAWATQMGQTFYLEGDWKRAIQRQADVLPLIDYEKKESTVNYLGEATVKGEQAYKLEFVQSGKDTTYFYFDAETFYLVKEESSSGSRILSNYEESGGVLWPRKFTVSSPQGQQVMTFDSIAVNTEIPDSLFVMPADAKPMPGMPAADSVQPSDSGE